MDMTTNTYYVSSNDHLLYDPVNGIAAAMDSSTAIGKSVEMTKPYSLAGSLYIPIIFDK